MLRETAGIKPADDRPVILVVDDDEWMLDMLSAYLRAHRYRVMRAANGRQALALFKHLSEELSLVVSDVEMPIMSGTELASAIHATHDDFPILLISGRRLPSGFESRTCEYLAKPFDPQTFLEVVARLVTKPKSAAGVERSPVDGQTGHRLRLIVADDHTEVRESVAALLRRKYEVVGVFGDGPTLLERAAELHPNLILLDISMPGMNGFEVARSLRELLPDVPVVFMTQHEGRVYIEEAMRSGAAGYVLKRTLSAELEPAVEQVYAGKKYLSPYLFGR